MAARHPIEFHIWGWSGGCVNEPVLKFKCKSGLRRRVTLGRTWLEDCIGFPYHNCAREPNPVIPPRGTSTIGRVFPTNCFFLDTEVPKWPQIQLNLPCRIMHTPQSRLCPHLRPATVAGQGRGSHDRDISRSSLIFKLKPQTVMVFYLLFTLNREPEDFQDL